jgi:hypothetical protein
MVIRWLVMDVFTPVRAVAAAGVALGVSLAQPPDGVDMGASGHSMVLRAVYGDGGTVIVKAYAATPAGRTAFAREAAGLAFSAPTGIGPALLTADPAFPLVVLEDLGSAPSLAKLLLDRDVTGVREVLLEWVRTVGRLAAWSATLDSAVDSALDSAVDRGGRAELTRHYSVYGGSAEPGWQQALSRAVRSAAEMLGSAGVPVPSGLDAEVESLVTFLLADEYPVFSPGDLCPDNDMRTPAGVRLIDFEDACFHSVFLDAAYLRMPFSTCWCVLRLPVSVGAALEGTYRQMVAKAFPALAEDAVWQPGMRRATAVWTLHAMTYLLDRSLGEDRSMNADVPGAPTARALLRYRWQMLRNELAGAAPVSAAAGLPALAEAMSGLLAVTEHWQAPPLPVYPAFS